MSETSWQFGFELGLLPRAFGMLDQLRMGAMQYGLRFECAEAGWLVREYQCRVTGDASAVMAYRQAVGRALG